MVVILEDFTELEKQDNFIQKKESLWLLCRVQHSVIIADYHDWNTTAYYSYYFDYVLSLPFKGSCRTSVIHFRIFSSFYVRYKSVEPVHMFYYVPHSLINRAPWNDAASLTTYTTHTHASDTRIYIYIYRSNLWESNYGDGPSLWAIKIWVLSTF